MHITKTTYMHTYKVHKNTSKNYLPLTNSFIFGDNYGAWRLIQTEKLIVWFNNAHPVHQKVSRLFGPRYIGDDFFLGPNLVSCRSFIRVIVPYEISKVYFRVESKILVSMSEEI
jgi:hypothetical protein